MDKKIFLSKLMKFKIKLASWKIKKQNYNKNQEIIEIIEIID